MGLLAVENQHGITSLGHASLLEKQITLFLQNAPRYRGRGGITHAGKCLPGFVEQRTQRIERRWVFNQETRCGRVSDEACSRLLEHAMIENRVAEDTSEVRLVHVALVGQVFERNRPAVEGYVPGDVIAVDGFEAGGVDLVRSWVLG